MTVQSFLRWPGSKKWLVRKRSILEHIEFDRYVEPFLGGGAVFFSTPKPDSVIGDRNNYLINCFKWMKRAPLKLNREFEERFSQHSTEFYYAVRERLQSNGLSGAADFLYLNRTCFNGVFRVNSRGKFNVPVGTKVSNFFTVEDFQFWGRALKNAQISCSDFEVLIDQSGEGDLLFVDPPYTVAHNKNGFIEYNEKIFSWADQERLHTALKKATSRGAKFIMTNADHTSLRDLYGDNYSIETVIRSSGIAGKVEARKPISELIVRNFAVT